MTEAARLKNMKQTEKHSRNRTRKWGLSVKVLGALTSFTTEHFIFFSFSWPNIPHSNHNKGWKCSLKISINKHLLKSQLCIVQAYDSD